jgi:hypothetical protein
VQADEVRAAERADSPKRAAALLEQDDVLGAARPERLDEPPALGELLGEGERHACVGGCDQNRVERRCSGSPALPSPTTT